MERVRELLHDFEFGKKSRQTLVRMGKKAFPAFETILTDPKSDPTHVARIFVVLRGVDADRQRFVDPALLRLADPDRSVRYFAVWVLEGIGRKEDTPPVVALLTDTDPTISYKSATTLLAIGDHRTVAAMDVWLNSGNHRDKTWLLKHVAKCRDELKQRLEKEKKARN